MLDTVATVAAVAGVGLAAAQVYYARLQLKRTTAPSASTADAFRSLRFARPWRPGWVQLYVGAALVGLALRTFQAPLLSMVLQESAAGDVYEVPSDGLAAAMLILGLMSATPTVAYQSSLALPVWRISFATSLFISGLLGGLTVPDLGLSLLGSSLILVVLGSAVAYGARTQPAWRKFWEKLESDSPDFVSDMEHKNRR